MKAEDRLLATLFDTPNRKHIDVKFCRGRSDDISPEDLCNQACNAFVEVDLGLAETRVDFGDGDRKQIDVSLI